MRVQIEQREVTRGVLPTPIPLSPAHLANLGGPAMDLHEKSRESAASTA